MVLAFDREITLYRIPELDRDRANNFGLTARSQPDLAFSFLGEGEQHIGGSH